MSKRTLILIIALIAITGLLLVLALGQNNTKQSFPIIPNLKPSPISQAQTVLAITPNPLSISSSSASVTVEVDSGENNLTAAQLELSYDPKVLSNVVVTPGTYFDNPVVLINTINTENGRISYAIAVPPSGTPKKGTGSVAKITFISLLKEGEETKLDILDKSLVTAEGISESVLKEIHGATIMFQSTSQ